jgi:hypothetical protein
MKHTIRRVSAVSVFRVSFFLYWLIGIVVAICYGVFFGIMALIPGVLDDPEWGGMGQLIGGIGAFALIVGGFFMSILYGVFGAIVSALLALAYNLIARTIGGFELELEEKGGSSTPYSEFGLRPPPGGAFDFSGAAAPSTVAEDPPAPRSPSSTPPAPPGAAPPPPAHQPPERPEE